MSSSRYDVNWNSSSVAYITGPGVEALRLDFGDNIDTEAIAEALEGAYAAGRRSVDIPQLVSDMDRAGDKIRELEAENIRLNSQLNQIILADTIGGQEER